MVLIGILLMVTAAMAAPNIQPGQWQITTTIEMPGMHVRMPTMTTTQCLSIDDLIPRQTSPTEKQKGSPCKIANMQTKGNKVIWDVVCNGQGQNMKGHGEITYHGDTMEGKVTMKMVTHGQGTKTMIMHMKGKRLGECKRE